MGRRQAQIYPNVIHLNPLHFCPSMPLLGFPVFSLSSSIVLNRYFHILVNSMTIWSVLKLPKIAWPSHFNAQIYPFWPSWQHTTNFTFTRFTISLITSFARAVVRSFDVKTLSISITTERFCSTLVNIWKKYLTIIPRARMGSESIAHEAEGRMGYLLRAHESERNNCSSKIQLVGQKNIETKTSFAS